MNLQTAIEIVLTVNKNKLHINEVSEIINNKKLYVRADRKKIEPIHIKSSVKKNSLAVELDENILRLKSYKRKSIEESFTLENRNLALEIITLHKAYYFNQIQRENYDFHSKGWLSLMHHFFNHREFNKSFISSLSIKDLKFEFIGQTSASNQKVYNQVNQFLYFLYTIDWKIIKHSFVFDKLLFAKENNETNIKYTDTTPIEIYQVFSKLISLGSANKVYNPFAGYASFGLFPSIENYIGEEIDVAKVNIAKHRLFVHDKNHGKISAKESFDSILNSDFADYDLIISFPPIEGFLWNTKSKQGYRYSFLVLFNEALDLLSDKGRLIALIQKDFLFSKKYEKERKYIVDANYLDYVITLPPNTLHFSKAELAIVQIKKNKLNKEIKIVDGSHLFVEESKTTIWDADEICSIIDSLETGEPKLTYKKNAIGTWGKIVQIDRIVEGRYILTPNRYMIKDFDGISLCKYLNDINVQSNQYEDEIKLVRIRDLVNSKTDFNLNTEKIVKVKYNSPTHMISESCLLVAKQFKRLKPTYFEYTGESIYIATNIMAFKINTEKISLEYLINELHSDKVQEQLEAYQSGAAIPFINLRDFLNIKIDELSLPDQQIKMQSVGKKRLEYKLKEAQDVAETNGLNLDYFQDFSELKHALGSQFSNISSGVENVKTILEHKAGKNEVIGLDTDLNISSVNSLRSIFISIENGLSQVSKLLNSNHRTLYFEDYKKEPIDAVLLFEYLTNKWDSLHSEKFQLQGSIAPMGFEYKKDQVFIDGNFELFDIMFDTLIDNIIVHGFESKSSQDNKVFAHFEDTIHNGRSCILIEIANNGLPFPEGFTKSQFIQKNSFAGDTGNTGIGGHHINRITWYFNGEFDLDLDKNSNTPVEYSFYFPIVESNITDNEI